MQGKDELQGIGGHLSSSLWWKCNKSPRLCQKKQNKKTVKDYCYILLLLPTGDVTAKQNSNHVTYADLLRG